MLIHVLIILCFTSLAASQMNGLPYFFGGQSGNDMGNVYVGNELAVKGILVIPMY
uniref:COesterase domain-containing protein n=1 Tax=Heterorhabditis bacteriophora TaxID=37862 RepID=A0A1I7X470_HETBA